jgi:uncharacterized repeat protein (TIGR03803 family)
LEEAEMKMKSVLGAGATLLLAGVALVQAQTFTVLHRFNLKDGQNPQGTLVRDSAGNLYGTTLYGGATATGGEDVGNGTVFKLTPSGTETVLHSFTGPDGAYPYAGLTPGGNDIFYGNTGAGGEANCPESGYTGCGAVFKITAIGDFTLLYDFKGPSDTPTDGYEPYASLYRNSAGYLFGTTLGGGVTAAFESFGCGTVYEVTPAGAESVLYSFDCTDDPTADGWHPESSLIADAEGDLYGTTTWGGLTNCNSPYDQAGCGTVFRLRKGPDGWQETVLYRFTGNSDGSYPEAGLAMDSEGNLYGTASSGGDLSCPTTGGTYGCGVVFKLSKEDGVWNETVLYAFPGGAHGAVPESQLVLDTAGNLYGTAVNGGYDKCPYPTSGYPGCGVVFKLTPAGEETVLHAFEGTDGVDPLGGLLLDPSNHTLYGTTTAGGDIAHCSLAEYYSGCGVVYKVTTE